LSIHCRFNWAPEEISLIAQRCLRSWWRLPRLGEEWTGFWQVGPGRFLGNTKLHSSISGVNKKVVASFKMMLSCRQVVGVARLAVTSRILFVRSQQSLPKPLTCHRSVRATSTLVGSSSGHGSADKMVSQLQNTGLFHGTKLSMFRMHLLRKTCLKICFYMKTSYQKMRSSLYSMKLNHI